MFKTVNYIVLFSLLSCVTAKAMGIKPAIVKNGIVEGATHYSIINGGITNRGTPGEYTTPPRAFFYGAKHDQDFLGEVVLDDLSLKTLEKVDTMIDPHATGSAPITIKFVHCMKRGRWGTGFDRDGNRVVQIFHYDGSSSLDLQSEARAGNLSLPRPPSFYDHLEVVEEDVPRSLLLALMGFSPLKDTLRYPNAPKEKK